MKIRLNPFLKFHVFAATMTVVFSAPALLAGTIWDGGGTDTNINTANNWDSNVVNAINGTTTATFGTGGSTATINTNASFTGIVINRDGNFQIANGNGSLTIGSGGITVTLPNTTGRTHTISESSVILGADQTWSITNNTGAAQLDVTGVISGASRVLTKTGTGTLRLTGANTFSGGLSVDEGTVLAQTSGSALGAGTVNLGATTAGTNNVSLSLGTSATISNNIVVRSGNSGTVTINNFAAYNPTVTGTLTLNKGLTINNNDNSSPFDTNMTFSGKISGGAANTLTLTGSNIANQITLSNAANDYTGATAVNSGTLRLTGGLGNTAVTVASGAAIAGEGTIGATGSLTFADGGYLRADGNSSGALSVGGDLTFGANTNVILEGVSATTGTGVSFRLLDYTGNLAGGATNFVLQNAASFRAHSFSTAVANQVNMTLDTKSIIWSGGSADWDVATTSNWDTGSEKFYQGDAVTFNDTGSNKAVALATSVMPASVTFNNSIGNDYSLTGAGAITGGSALTKSGTGNLTISTANTYSGGTTLSASSGTLLAEVSTSKNGIGTGAASIGAGSTLQLNNLNTSSSTVTLANTFTGTGILKVNFAADTTNGRNTVLSNVGGFSGTIQLSNSGSNADKWSAGGVNATSASVQIDSGSQLYIANGTTTFSSINVTGTGNSETRGAIRMGAATLNGPITLAGNTTLGLENASAVVAGTIQSGTAGTQTLTIGTTNSSGSGTISGAIGGGTGTIALTKEGSGTLTLSGANTYTGATTVSAGILKLGDAGALGNSTNKTSGVTVSSAGVFDLNGISPTVNVTLNLNSTASTADIGSLTNTAGGVNGGATATYGGAVNLGASTVVVGGGGNSGGSGNITLTGSITGNGNSLKKDGLGILTLNNSGTVTLGSLLANRGTIEVGSGTNLSVTGINVGSGSSVGSGLTLNGGNVTSSGAALFGIATSGTATATLQLNSGSTLTVPSLGKSGSAGTSVVFNANFNGGTLKANASSATFFTGANSAKIQNGGLTVDDGGNAITIGQALTPDTASTGGLTKTGSGTLTLTNTNTFTGETTINNGKIALGIATALQNSAYNTTGSTGAIGLDVTGYATPTLGGLSGSVNLATAITGYGGVTNLTLNPQTDYTVTYAGNITNGAANMQLTKSGAGTQILTGTNSYSGTTTLNGGKLTVSGSGNINPTTGATLSVQGNSTFQYDSSATSKFGAMNVGTGGSGNSGTLNQSNGVINATGMTLGGGNSSSFGGTVSIGNVSGNAAELNVSGDVSVGASGAYNSSLTVNSTGALNVTGNLNMATSTSRDSVGTITQHAGSVVSAASLSLSSNVSDVSSRAHTSVYNHNGGTLSVGSITTGVVTTSGTISNTFNFNGGTLKATASSASFWASSAYTTANVKDGGAKIDTAGYDITIGQSLLHFAGATTDSLTKSGLGTLTLTGTNTYTGATQVNEGKLVIGSGGSLANTAVTAGGSSATVGSKPTMGGVGTIGGATIIAAAGGGAVGTHAPGIAGSNGGVGTQNFSNSLAYQSGSIFEWDLKTGAEGTPGTDFDQVVLDTASGSLSVDGTTTTGSIFKIVLGETFDGGNTFWSDSAQKSWNVFAVTGGATLGSSVFSRFQLFDTTSTTVPVDFSSYGSFSFTNSGTVGTLTWAAVPEPTSALAGLLITAGLLRRRRAL